MFAAIRNEEDDTRLDLNGDGTLNQQDADYLLSEAFKSRRGDADLNGQVAFKDFLALAAAYGKSNAVWEEGDFDGDGTVAFADFIMLTANYGL